jgi:hypothetical protein
MSVETMGEVAALLEAMGVGLGAAVESDPAAAALRHNLFRGAGARNWAETLYRIAAAATDQQQPLTWTLNHVPVETQRRLLVRGQLLAIDRFRYVDVSTEGAVPRMSGSYVNEKQTLFQGNAADANLNLRFYRTSRDRNPAAALPFNRPLAIFDLYLKGDYAADDKGNMYIPLYFEDEADRYVYYLSLEFSREIPDASSWYSLAGQRASGKWPDLTSSEGFITERRSP